MNIELAITMIGPVVLIVNIASMFLCFRPKRRVLFTLCLSALYWAAIHFVYNPLVMFTPFAPYGGIIAMPVMVWLFKGPTFQKVFAFFMCGQVSSMQVSIANVFTASSYDPQSPEGQTMFFALSMILLCVYMAVVLRYGKRFFERVFVNSSRGVWAVYSLGAAFSFVISSALQWQSVGPVLYIALLLFILWSFGVLCFTIINTHEKTEQAHHTEALELQMGAVREQAEAKKKHLEDMEIMRHDMRHEMGVIMELYRTGKTAEADAVYDSWQNMLKESAPVLLCADHMLNAVFTRFVKRAENKNISLYINTNIQRELPIDTVKLSVMVAKALENALRATEDVQAEDKRVIRVKLIKNDCQIDLEVTNPIAAPVEFNEKGLPVTHDLSRDIGVRSIAAFARDNEYILNFSIENGKFIMRLVMELEAEVSGNAS